MVPGERRRSRVRTCVSPNLQGSKAASPSRKAQFCTEALKLAPIRRWIEEHYPNGNYARFTGVRRDESPSRSHREWQEWDDYYDCELYNPVFDWTKQMCFDYVKHHGEQINPLYTRLAFRASAAPRASTPAKTTFSTGRLAFPEMIDKVRAWERYVGRTFFAPCVPGKQINWIDEVVAWAKTDRGGRQNNMFRILPPTFMRIEVRSMRMNLDSLFPLFLVLRAMVHSKQIERFTDCMSLLRN